MPDNASLSVEFQNFLTIGKYGGYNPLAWDQSLQQKTGWKSQKNRQVKWATHWTGEGERAAEPQDMPLMLPPFHDTRFWNPALIGQMSQCWQIHSAVDRWNTMLLQYRNASMCFQTQISNKQYIFFCETFHISLGSKKSKKYVYGL